MPAVPTRPEVRLRVLVIDDADWVVQTDRGSATALARPLGWEEQQLAAELRDGRWAGEDRWAWAVMVDGEPSGFAVVEGLDQRDAVMTIRIGPATRGRGVGREVLRQLADHHFSANPSLVRLTGRAHEHNIPMQRVFNAAGFRMEARFRDAVAQQDGRYAAEWGYALTRADWDAGRHRQDTAGYDLHGLSFEVAATREGPDAPGLLLKFLQEGRRALARYQGDHISDGELAGILVGDLLRYRYVHTAEADSGASEVSGRGRGRLQRRDDGRLELIDQWSDEQGGHGRRVMVQRVDPGRTD